MVSVGDVAVKIAGRDAGQICAVIEVVDERFVFIDGNVRRRKCNINHLEFLEKQVKIRKGAERENVLEALKEAGLKFKEIKKGKSKDRKERVRSLRVQKSKAVKAKTKEVKKVEVKAEKTKEAKNSKVKK